MEDTDADRIAGAVLRRLARAVPLVYERRRNFGVHMGAAAVFDLISIAARDAPPNVARGHAPGEPEETLFHPTTTTSEPTEAVA